MVKNYLNDLDLRETFFNFTEQAGIKNKRNESTLNKVLDYSRYGLLTRKEFIYHILQEGYKPAKKENYTYYKRDGNLSVPKTLYKVENEDRYYEITKTEYKYALHLIENDYTNIDKARKFIESEEEKRQKAIQLQREKEEEERLQREEERRKRKEENKKRHEQNVKKWKHEANLFIERLGYNPIKELLDELVPLYVELDEKENNRIVPKEQKEAFYNEHYERLVLVLGNIDYTKHQLKYYEEYDKKHDFRNVVLHLEQELLKRVYKDVLGLYSSNYNKFYAGIDKIWEHDNKATFNH